MVFLFYEALIFSYDKCSNIPCYCRNHENGQPKAIIGNLLCRGEGLEKQKLVSFERFIFDKVKISLSGNIPFYQTPTIWYFVFTSFLIFALHGKTNQNTTPTIFAYTQSPSLSLLYKISSIVDLLLLRRLQHISIFRSLLYFNYFLYRICSI